MDAQRFWMVSSDGPCNYRHASRHEAEQEAKRLARLNPGHWFYVVEAVSAHRRIDVESVNLRADQSNDDGIPS